MKVELPCHVEMVINDGRHENELEIRAVNIDTRIADIIEVIAILRSGTVS